MPRSAGETVRGPFLPSTAEAAAGSGAPMLQRKESGGYPFLHTHTLVHTPSLVSLNPKPLPKHQHTHTLVHTLSLTIIHTPCQWPITASRHCRLPQHRSDRTAPRTHRVSRAARGRRQHSSRQRQRGRSRPVGRPVPHPHRALRPRPRAPLWGAGGWVGGGPGGAAAVTD